MKAKVLKKSPVAVMCEAASEIVQSTRRVFEECGRESGEIRIPVLVHGTDMRVTIEAGPKIAARNAIEHAQMKASGEPVQPIVDMSRVITEAKALLAQYASEIRNSETTGDGDWMDATQDAQSLHTRCIATVAGMNELERLL